MSRAARSVYIFGWYLIGVGGVLVGSPNTMLALVRVPAAHEPWIHVLGVAVMGMGLVYLTNARDNHASFLRSTVRTRLFAFGAFVALAVAGIIPPIVAVFGLADAAGAAWTHVALRTQ
jgi:hypothetical protein